LEDVASVSSWEDSWKHNREEEWFRYAELGATHLGYHHHVHHRILPKLMVHLGGGWKISHNIKLSKELIQQLILMILPAADRRGTK
jgi:hypothetical protein